MGSKLDILYIENEAESAPYLYGLFFHCFGVRNSSVKFIPHIKIIYFIHGYEVSYRLYAVTMRQLNGVEEPLPLSLALFLPLLLTRSLSKKVFLRNLPVVSFPASYIRMGIEFCLMEDLVE